MTATSDQTTESIALRAFAMLEQIVNAPGPMSLDEITLALKLPKPTVFRIVNLLNDASLLRREPASKRYTIGPRLTSFAVDLWRSDTLRVQWHRALEDAVTEIGGTRKLTLLYPGQPTIRPSVIRHTHEETCVRHLASGRPHRSGLDLRNKVRQLSRNG